jgi:hypothetical protein
MRREIGIFHEKSVKIGEILLTFLFEVKDNTEVIRNH